MNPRTSLAAAIACGAAAVALVAADLAFGVDARLEVKGADGSWTVVAQSDAPPTHYWAPACGNDLRLTVHNGLPWATTVTVRTSLLGPAPGPPSVESWPLAAGERRSKEFHLDGTPRGEPSAKGFESLLVQVGDDIHLHAGVCPEASA